MNITANCVECGATIKTIKLRRVRHDWTITDEEIEETMREIEEQSRAGFLRLFCESCNRPVDIETTRGRNEHEKN